MIWLTWQQHRLMVFVGGLVLVLLVPFLIITGLNVIQEAHAAIACPPPDTSNDCLRGFFFLVSTSPVLPALSSLPLLLGAFVGAPLVSRELEQGTYLLAWTQGVPRRRWLLAKLGMLFALTCLGFAALAGLMAWWAAPADPLVGSWVTFEVRGLVPFAYAVFALALGVAAGAIVRQVVPAMFATAAIFVAGRLAVAQLRPHFLPPVSQQPTGHDVPWTSLVVQKVVQKGSIGPLRFHFLYQPSDRFWMFQGIEAAIFVALALALLALTLWWMRHRIA
jgi:ABC-type transport system involved in multi-copper enzyme maturation permease subunit